MREVEQTDEDLGRLEVFRARLRHSLPARFVLRFHVTLIVLAAIAAGWTGDVLLLHAGLRSMLLRYPLVIAVSYGAFLAGVAAWLRHSGIGEYVDRRKAEQLVGDHVPSAPRDASIHWDGWDPAGAIPADGEGCLLALLFGLVVLAFGGYTVMTAPTFFADIVVELLLAAGMLRGIRRSRESRWMSSVWSNTWGSVVVALILAFIAGMLGRAAHPPATTLLELWVRLHAR
ncbi:MAG TPA: hypothetical protein VFE23_01155 [Usitatibacter sp.]|jgi:hypothetical protein|nr:hypothetical protein [Usitatibacter sp.]